MIPKTQAGKLSKKTSEQSEQGKSLQSKQHNSEGLVQSEQSTTEKDFVQRDGSSNSGKSLRSKQDKQAQQDDSEKYLRSKPSKQGDLLQTTEIRELASPAELRRVSDHKVNDSMPKISAKQRRAKKGVEGSSTKKGVKESSTYFTVGFKPQAKSGPEQNIDSGNAEHVNNISGLNAKKGTRKPQLMAVSKTFNKTFNNKDVKLQPNEDPLHFGFELHATRVAQRDGPSDGHRGGGRNGGRGKFNRGGRGNNRRGRGEVSQAGKKRNFSGCYRVNAQQISGSTSMDYDPLQTTRQSNNSKNGYSTSRGTKNVKEDCIRFGGKEYIAVNGDKRNQESRGFRGHKPEICDPQYQIRSSSSRAYYARMNRLDESLRCGEASMSAIAYNEPNISGSTWMDDEQSYVLGDLYG